ncbi:MAG TPA: MFS transporter [Casimicrobiaceae bacterium]|nr:MFS transporter [Casimicrobiaceae bacterium]
MTAPRFLPLYACFAAAYVLSYTYRTINAVISPELTAELGISASSLGLLTSAYFVAFASMQVACGVLLDRYGPRRVEPVLLVLATVGALAFAAADTLTGLTAARALIGAGVAVCLMAPLKAIATWYPLERQPSLGGWMMFAGGVGALLSTTPLAAALNLMSWRAIFVALAAATLAVAIAIALVVPDTPQELRAAAAQSSWRGVKLVYRHARLWWIAPLTGLGMGSLMAIQGLWSVPWMIEVDGYTRSEAANRLLAMGLTTLAGYAFVALASTRLARLGIAPRHLVLGGYGLQVAMLALIATSAVPFTYLLWALYGLTAAVNILGYLLLNEGFSRELAGRASTALNLVMFSTSFVVQWGIGAIADASRATFGLDLAGGLRAAFGVVLIAEIAAYAWFAMHWRRHSVVGGLASVAG